MSKTDPYQKYVTFDVRAHYNYKDDTITLTSKDPDVAKQGFRVKLSKNTKEELRLRQLLKQEGVIQRRTTRDAQVITMVGDIRKFGIFRENSAVVLANYLVDEFKLSTVVVDLGLISEFSNLLDYTGRKTLLDVFLNHEDENSFVSEQNVLDKIETIPGSRASFLLAPERPPYFFKNYKNLLADNIIEIFDILKKNFDRIIINCDTYSQRYSDFMSTVPYTESDLILLFSSAGAGYRHFAPQDIIDLNRNLDDCIFAVKYIDGQEDAAGVNGFRVNIDASDLNTNCWSYKKDDVFIETTFDDKIIQYTPLYHYDFFVEKHAELANLIAHYQV